MAVRRYCMSDTGCDASKFNGGPGCRLCDVTRRLPQPAWAQPDRAAKFAEAGSKPNDPHRNDPARKKRRRKALTP